MGKVLCKIKLRRDPTSEKSDMYESKTALFDNGKPEEFLLFVRNFKMMIDASGTLADNVKLHCIRTLLCGEALRQFFALCYQVLITTMVCLNRVGLGLGMYFFPLGGFSKQNLMMQCRISNMHK